jgi:hypothetical protein
MFCALGPSAVEFPDELITCTHITQTCLESTIGSIVSTQSGSAAAESTPLKSPSSSFDALVRENRNLIERVMRFYCILRITSSLL